MDYFNLFYTFNYFLGFQIINLFFFWYKIKLCSKESKGMDCFYCFLGYKLFAKHTTFNLFLGFQIINLFFIQYNIKLY